MAYAVKTKRLKSQPTAVIRTAFPPARFGSAFPQLLWEVHSYLEEQGDRPTGPPFARYFDYSTEQADLEAGFPVRKPVPGGDRVSGEELPGGKAAITRHSGPYEGLQKAHDAIGDWVLARGHDPAGAVWEVYLTDPREQPDQSGWETEVIWPLRR